MTLRVSVCALALCLSACGAKSGLIVPDVADVMDAVDVRDVHDVQDAFVREGCVPVNDQCGESEVCGNGLDDNCDGRADENCPCDPGTVQSCFTGPPGRRNIGVCRDGSQTCTQDATWGDCVGGILPQPDECNGTDNLCTGCSQHRDCPIMCPSPGDSRVPDGQPFRDYPLQGELFYMGGARSWHWDVLGGPCDSFTTQPSFTVRNPNGMDAVLAPLLSGDYQVTLTVVTDAGTTLTCTWVVHIAGPGVRIEMCYPENTTVDLDLYVHKPGSEQNWFPDAMSIYSPLPDSCNWSDCEAVLRGSTGMRADWGYANSPLSACQYGPHGPDWIGLGFCANPRLDIDNNLQKATGVPENVNIDDPNDGDTFRIMVQDFSGTRAHPLVNVYCSGRRVATYGQPPSTVTDFAGDGEPNIGAMWRVAEVTAHVRGATTTCDVHQLHRPGFTMGYWVTYNDPEF